MSILFGLAITEKIILTLFAACKIPVGLDSD
jgi:hypothetical protein